MNRIDPTPYTMNQFIIRALATLFFSLAVYCGISKYALGTQDAAQDAPASAERIANVNDNLLAIDGAIMKTIETTSVASQVSGLIQSMNVKEGSRVQRGAPLAQIRDDAIKLQVELSKIAIRVAKKKQSSTIDEEIAAKSQAVAANEYERALRANENIKDVYPAKEIDRMKLVLDRASLERERAVHQRELAEMDVETAAVELRKNQELLERHRLISPCDGMVVSVDKRVGEWAEPGMTVVKIVEIDRLRIEGFMSAADASPELIGTKAQVTVDVSNSTLRREAELVFISPEINPLNSQVRVFLEIDNRDGTLRPGLRPKVSLNRQP
jgi:multidrug resistance efflux pump